MCSTGDLARPGYPELLATSAGRRWRRDALSSLGYAAAALRARRDLTVALSNAGRGLVEAAHSALAYRGQWALNEKGIVARAGLEEYAQQILRAVDEESLETVDCNHARAFRRNRPAAIRQRPNRINLLRPINLLHTAPFVPTLAFEADLMTFGSVGDISLKPTDLDHFYRLRSR